MNVAWVRAVGLACLFLVACAAPSQQTASDPMESALAAATSALEPLSDETAGREAFELFLRGAIDELRRSGQEQLALQLEQSPSSATDANSASNRLLRGYVVARYGQRMVSDLQEMVRFRTHAVEGQENWHAPEFLRQREWLAARAASLGLDFRSVDGRVDEVTLPGEERLLAVLTHGDVQGVEQQSWEHPPWEGLLVGDRIVGRGTEDDKGPIVATLYVLAALADSDWPRPASLRLIIANGEESSWDEIPYYLARAEVPELTLGVDASYPVTHAQKAWAMLDLTAATGAPRDAGRWHVRRVEGGSGLSIIPDRASAWLDAPATLADAAALLSTRASAWMADHPSADLQVDRDGDALRVTARGRGGHSSEPQTGHNAFGDLTAFLSALEESLDGAAGGWSQLVDFVGATLGSESDGAMLGIAHDDPIMGALTVNISLVDLLDELPRFRVNLRVPRGIDAETIRSRVEQRLVDYGAPLGTRPSFELEMPLGPHFVAPDSKLVRTLLDVWEAVTGERGYPVAIGGGTQARMFPQGVDFGPAHAMEAYRGHGPDEYMTVGELERNARLTMAALWSLMHGE